MTKIPVWQNNAREFAHVRDATQAAYLQHSNASRFEHIHNRSMFFLPKILYFADGFSCMFVRLLSFRSAKLPISSAYSPTNNPHYIAPSTSNLVINVILLQPPFVTDDPGPHLLYVHTHRRENMPARCRNRDAYEKRERVKSERRDRDFSTAA